MIDFVQTFIDRLRVRASDAILGQSAEARIVNAIADELEAQYQAHQSEELNTRQAAEESGYTMQAIRDLRAKRLIGVARRDLPRKPGHGVVKGPRAVTADGSPSIADRVLRGRKRAS